MIYRKFKLKKKQEVNFLQKWKKEKNKKIYVVDRESTSDQLTPVQVSPKLSL